jgi:hypothetical protein
LTQPNSPVPLIDLDVVGGADWEVEIHRPDFKEQIFGEGPSSVMDHVVLPIAGNNEEGSTFAFISMRHSHFQYPLRSPFPSPHHYNTVYNQLGEPEEVELAQIDEYIRDHEKTPTSRLASRITLDKSLDGIVVSVPEPPPAE